MPSWRDRFDLDLGWRATLCAVAAVIVGLGLVWPEHRVPAIGVICLTVGCWPFLAEALGLRPGSWTRWWLITLRLAA